MCDGEAGDRAGGDRPLIGAPETSVPGAPPTVRLAGAVRGPLMIAEAIEPAMFKALPGCC